jgi:hypothetical protein
LGGELGGELGGNTGLRKLILINEKSKTHRKSMFFASRIRTRKLILRNEKSKTHRNRWFLLLELGLEN